MMNIKEEYNFIVVNTHFPRLGLGIEIRWGTKELEPYIANLIKDTRENTRQGFPVHVHNSLLSLIQIHNSLFPQFKFDPGGDFWLGNFTH